MTVWTYLALSIGYTSASCLLVLWTVSKWIRLVHERINCAQSRVDCLSDGSRAQAKMLFDMAGIKLTPEQEKVLAYREVEYAEEEFQLAANEQVKEKEHD